MARRRQSLEEARAALAAARERTAAAQAQHAAFMQGHRDRMASMHAEMVQHQIAAGNAVLERRADRTVKSPHDKAMAAAGAAGKTKHDPGTGRFAAGKAK